MGRAQSDNAYLPETPAPEPEDFESNCATDVHFVKYGN
jgi:hypothetical protein